MTGSKTHIKEKLVSALNGDTESMGILFERFRPNLYVHALQICGNTPIAKDAVQDTFISAFTHLHTLRNTDLFYPWLKRILINNCYQLLRKEKCSVTEDATRLKDIFIQQSIEEQFEKVSNQQSLHDALVFLSEELRSCVMLRYFSSFNSYNEIAMLLGIPVGTVRSRLSAAREKLVRLYSQLDDTGGKNLNQSKQWSYYYEALWANLYDDGNARNELFKHLHPALCIRFTSGKQGKGRAIIEKEISDDLQYGTRFNSTEITSCGNISVIEGVNLNTIEYPDRCAPSSVLVLFRENDRVSSLHIFDSARK